MTCIAAITCAGRVYMAGDSAVTSDTGSMYNVAEPKIWHDQNHDIVFGFGGELAVGLIARYRLLVPPLPALENGRWGSNPLTWVACDFIDALRDAFRTAGRLRITNNMEEIDGQILVGLAGRIFTIDEGLGVTCESDCFTAIGTGVNAARGALYALTQDHMPRSSDEARFYLETALAAAERFTNNVRKPFMCVETKP